jgi:DNA ligase (NAD+)
VVGFFKDARNKDLLKNLAKSGLTLKETATATGPRPLADQTYVVTGTLPTLSRQQARDLIEGAGGHVSDSLSKKTTALIVGADPGSKLEKAKALGVEQIDETELLRRANRKP